MGSPNNLTQAIPKTAHCVSNGTTTLTNRECQPQAQQLSGSNPYGGFSLSSLLNHCRAYHPEYRGLLLQSITVCRFPLQLCLDFLFDARGRVLDVLFHRFEGFGFATLLAGSVQENAAALNGAHEEEAEVHRRKTMNLYSQFCGTTCVGTFTSIPRNTYSIFCGRMTKHHRVQIEPVAMSAAFWVRDNFSAGRKKSDAPARTTPHFMTGAL